jgi:hypothetical protein
MAPVWSTLVCHVLVTRHRVGFIENLVSTNNYKTLKNLPAVQITTAHTMSCYVIISRCLLADSKEVEVKVTLRLTVSQSVSKSWCRAPFGLYSIENTASS